ncbi:hypothetical protein [Flagellimonas sp.]|uniref:hypothetical protein n=1 Tax=Flagellimonas sp. TaxID=2058762 RepID=UPI003BAB95DC
MKNVFFALAFMLVGTFAFAAEIEDSDLNVLNDIESSIDGKKMNSSNHNLSTLPFDCTVTIKNNKTGDSYTITVHGKSCEELIKEIMK